jgi:hypothetical protein
MEYLLLIYQTETEEDSAKLVPENPEPIFQEYGELVRQLLAEGKFRAGHQLKPTAAATTVRVREDRKTITDGPFAETKEQLGGYFLVEAIDLDDAISIAARIPGARDGSVEVRPVVVRGRAEQA